MGDAAHAMVPFYGQGMNAGFEDVHFLFSVLDYHSLVGPGKSIQEAQLTESQKVSLALSPPSHHVPNGLEGSLLDYSNTRAPNAYAVCDLAMDNYIEMRASVMSPSYLIRKKVDGVLNYWFPRFWKPLYSMVSFSTIPYAQVVKIESYQETMVHRTILGLAGIALGASLGFSLMGVLRYFKVRSILFFPFGSFLIPKVNWCQLSNWIKFNRME